MHVALLPSPSAPRRALPHVKTRPACTSQSQAGQLVAAHNAGWRMKEGRYHATLSAASVLCAGHIDAGAVRLAERDLHHGDVDEGAHELRCGGLGVLVTCAATRRIRRQHSTCRRDLIRASLPRRPRSFGGGGQTGPRVRRGGHAPSPSRAPCPQVKRRWSVVTAAVAFVPHATWVTRCGSTTRCGSAQMPSLSIRLCPSWPAWRQRAVVVVPTNAAGAVARRPARTGSAYRPLSGAMDGYSRTGTLQAPWMDSRLGCWCCGCGCCGGNAGAWLALRSGTCSPFAPCEHMTRHHWGAPLRVFGDLLL